MPVVLVKAGHGTHASFPLKFLYELTAHGVQTPPSRKLPTSHTHSDPISAPSSTVVKPESQELHASFEMIDLNLPI